MGLRLWKIELVSEEECKGDCLSGSDINSSTGAADNGKKEEISFGQSLDYVCRANDKLLWNNKIIIINKNKLKTTNCFTELFKSMLNFP